MRTAVPTGRLRRRLTIAFTLVAGVSALVLAAGSYWIVRETRLDDSVERALDQSRFNLELASSVLEGGTGRAATDELLAALSTRGDFETVGVADGDELLVERVARAGAGAGGARAARRGRPARLPA